jgi:PKD repeat protein
MRTQTLFARLRWLAAAGALLAALTLLSPAASAVVVHLPNGHFLSIAPRKGVKPSSIPGSVAALHQAAALTSNGTLSYHSGPVLHSSDPYLIFWTPAGDTLSATTESLLKRYFTDAAADSGGSSNVYGVNRQFTDGSGFADYSKTFSSSQAIVDTDAYPSRDVVNCPDVNASYPTCITDGQLTSEIQHLISIHGLPTGTGAGAPIYFVVLPTDVNECAGSTECADNVFCAYHSNFTDGGNEVLYGAIPTLLASTDPKGCQFDNNSAVQAPNGDQVGDVTIKYLSHEDNETITDPLGTGWWNSSSGNEDGDECNFWGSSVDPANGSNPNAFAPTLGGTAAAGTLYDQLINSNKYYIQSEWSNGDSNCELRPTSGTITPSFTEPAGPNAVGGSLSFNPAASSSSNSISSETWNWGDGSTSFHAGALTSVSHSYAAAGTYTVRLTLVDNRGNTNSTSQSITVHSLPVASFTFSPTNASIGVPVGFDRTGSSDSEAGVTISSYAWTFGDGATGTGATPSHAYASGGTYTVTLKVTNSVGLTNTTSKQVTVASDESPTAGFTFGPSSPVAGETSVSFDGSTSSDPDGSVTSYSWNFGDGTPAGSGANPSHTYVNAGTYTVSLTVTDSSSRTATISHQITVVADELPSAAFTFSPSTQTSGQPIAFDGSASSDRDGSIVSYAWNFGDGTTATGAKPSHAYKKPGTYTVTLGVVDSSRRMVLVSHSVTVVRARIVKIAIRHRTASAATLLVFVNAPGRVTAGGKTVRLRAPGQAKLKLKLTGLHPRAKVTFVPLFGPPSARTITL